MQVLAATQQRAYAEVDLHFNSQLRPPARSAIPRLLHQIFHRFPGIEEVGASDAGLRLQHAWRIKNPSWTLQFWDSERSRELIAKHYPAFLPLYLSLSPVQKVDSLRYFILHKYGGGECSDDLSDRIKLTLHLGGCSLRRHGCPPNRIARQVAAED